PARVCAVGKDLMRCRQSPAVPRPYHPVHGARTLSRGVTPASGHPPMLDHVETGEAGWRDTPACRHGDCCQDVHYLSSEGLQMTHISMLIDGQNVPSRSGATFERRNPLDGQVATVAPAATPEDAKAAVDAASRAFPAWAALGPGERRAMLLKAADALD